MLRVAIAAAVVALLFFSMSIAADVFYVTDVLHAGDAVFGMLMASWTLGMVAGAVGLARRVPAGAMAAAAVGAVALAGFAVGALGMAGVLIGAVGAQPALLAAGLVPLAVGVGSLLFLAPSTTTRTAHALGDA